MQGNYELKLCYFKKKKKDKTLHASIYFKTSDEKDLIQSLKNLSIKLCSH